jgi:hypothetical protein
MRATRSISALAFLAAACGGDKERPKGDLLVEDDRPAPVQVIGVSPTEFKCETVVPLDAVEAAIGRPLEEVQSGFTPAQGLPKPCHYASAIPEQPGEWSFDIDCRERAMTDFNALMAEHATKEGAKAILLGRSGLDHSGFQLLFADDDAPCYVRVNGPGEAERLALGRAVADGLSRRNAPGKVSYVEVTTDQMQPEAK